MLTIAPASGRISSVPFDPQFQSKPKGSRPYRIGKPPAVKPEYDTTDYGPKLTREEWNKLTHAQKMEYCRGDKQVQIDAIPSHISNSP